MARVQCPLLLCQLSITFNSIFDVAVAIVDVEPVDEIEFELAIHPLVVDVDFAMDVLQVLVEFVQLIEETFESQLEQEVELEDDFH